MVCCHAVVAQEIRSVRFDTIGWTFAPAVVGESEVIGFLSWTDTNTVGQNISLLWYEYDQYQDGFTTFAWKHDDVGAAAHWLREEFQNEQLFNWDDQLQSFMIDADPTLIISPQLFTEGLFENDPLVPVIEAADDPAPVLGTLTDIGYESAPLVTEMQATNGESSSGNGLIGIGQPPVPIDAQCIIDNGSADLMMLRDLYARAESLLVFGVDLPDERPCGWPCTCTATSTYAPAGPWTPPIPSISGTFCLWTRSITKTTTTAGKTFWRCRNCAGTTTSTTNEMAKSNLLPGDTCPTTPPPGSDTFYEPIPPGWPGF